MTGVGNLGEKIAIKIINDFLNFKSSMCRHDAEPFAILHLSCDVSYRSLTLNISKTVTDTAIVTIEDE